MKQILLTVITLYVASLKTVDSVLTASDANVCPKVETYKVSYRQSHVASSISRYTTICFAIPPVCTRYRTNYHTAYTTAYDTKINTTYECCAGYSEVADTCVPICSGHCNDHGKCVAPQQCICDGGWTGSDCGKTCSEGRFGSNCEGICRCQNGRCDKITGLCDCFQGWIGVQCEQRCSNGKYGHNCLSNCNCENGGTCDFRTGDCHCHPGFTGKRCESECPDGRWGSLCSNECDCLNGATCVKSSGECICAPGWKGNLCEFSCDVGTHGKDCVHDCDCKNGAGCDPQDGSCICRGGFKGAKCESPCDEGTWGHRCSHNCSCSNGATCLPTSGICVCAPGYIGEHCEDPCPPDTYGDQCLSHCDCQNNAWCEHKGGRCLCGPGYAGTYCENKCEPWYHGYKCEFMCDCPRNTTDRCDHISGKCVCLPGWTGSQCETKCENRTWGENCRNTCNCSDEIPCHQVSGECLCYPGWRGYNCTEKCPNGTFGEGCEEECPECPKNATCNAVYGFCECPLGYRGHFCNEACSSGSYGVMCSQKCNCDKGYVCNYVSGCVVAESSEQEKLALSGYSVKQTDLLKTLGALSAACVLVSVIVGWIMCNRKKKKIKKQSTVPLRPVEEDSENFESSACCSDVLQTNEQHGAVDNIYQEIPISKFPFPILEPLYENDEYSPDSKGRIVSTIPKQGFVLYANECSDGIYQELDCASNSEKDRCSGNYSEVGNAADNLLFQNAHINNVYGIEDENEESHAETCEPRAYGRLNLKQNEREANSENPYDKLKR